MGTPSCPQQAGRAMWRRRWRETNFAARRTTEKDMAGSVNKVILVGNLGKDPEVRRMTSGEPVVNLSVATSETWRDKTSGERKERTEWHRVVIFNEDLANVAEQYLRKGAKASLAAALQP